MSKWFVPGDLARKAECLLDRLLKRYPEPKRVCWSEAAAARWELNGFETAVTVDQADGLRGSAGNYSFMDQVLLEDIIGATTQKEKLIKNTLQFLKGLPANNVLLWGARGTGKSSLVRALLNQYSSKGLRLIEVPKDSLASLSVIVDRVVDEPFYFVVYCDDLSFSEEDDNYKVLKSALEGSIFSKASNIIIIATSNRRHLVEEYQSDNNDVDLRNGVLHFGDVVEERLSLSDRFGIWLSFYPPDQENYLEIARHWAGKLAEGFEGQLASVAKEGACDLGSAVEKTVNRESFKAEALRWALQKGCRSGRTAFQFAVHWVGEQALLKDSC